MSVTITKLFIPKSKLAGIPKAERSLFFMLGHISNELSALQRLLIVASNYKYPEPVRGAAHVSQALMMTRMLGGKCWEAWLYINGQVIEGKIGAAYRKHLTKEGRAALASLVKRFSSNKKKTKIKNVLRQMRNEFAFHYDQKESAKRLDASFGELTDAEIEFFSGGSRVNTLWYVSEVLVNHSMLQEVVPDDMWAAMNKVIGEIIEASDELSTFTDEMMWSIGRRHMGENHGIERTEDFPFPDAPSLHELAMPVFVSDTKESEAERDRQGG